jgi:hypothetical protein
MPTRRRTRAALAAAAAAILLAAAAAVTTSAAAGPAEGLVAAASPREQIAALKRQVAALRRQVARVTAQNRRLRAQNEAVSPAGVTRQLERVRTANARFSSADAARAAGYVEASPCESQPGTGFPAGGMGFHWVNPPALQDQAVDAMRPEILLYAPAASGGLELVGLEYWKADADQNLATDDDRPTLFGRAFDGPMLGHAPGMPIHYDLHVWLYKRNPSGMFAVWNPDVHCSGGHGH